MQKFNYELAQYDKATQQADYTVYTKNKALLGVLTVARLSKKSTYLFSAEFFDDSAIVISGSSLSSTIEGVMLDFERKIGSISIEIQNLFNS